jgi:polyribonucleotide 5'-hydroxyl-kinase
MELNIQRYTLPPENELRIEVSPSQPAFLRLLSGSAEIGGIELSDEKLYTLYPSRQLAVFTWYGAELALSGGSVSTSTISASAAPVSASSESGATTTDGSSSLSSSSSSSSSTQTIIPAVVNVYSSADSQIPLYANLHQRLEARRDEAKLSSFNGPRVMIVGPVDSGKSSLSRILLSYACRLGRSPTFVDLDIGQGEISIPGTISASPLDRLCLSAEDGLVHTTPIVFSFGHVTPGEYVPLYKNHVARLSDIINRRMNNDEIARCSGLVCNTMGWIDGEGYEIIVDAIRTLMCDVIVVMGNDRLFAQLSTEVANIKFPVATSAAAIASGVASATKSVTVVKLSRPGGVVDRPTGYRREARKARFKDYFYGSYRLQGLPSQLSPQVISVKFDDVIILKVGGPPPDAGLVPIGKTSTLSPLRTQIVNPGPALVNHVLGVSFATNEAQVPHMNVAGFVHVRSVKMDTKIMQIMLPTGSQLPYKYLILGSTVWVEA